MNHAATPKLGLETTNLAGKYHLIAELGQGGMATVFLAVMLGGAGFRKLAVVKLLRSELANDAEFVQMFLDEARLCARLSHPNIVHTYDVGVDAYGHLIAMEYLDGVSLHSAVAKLRKNGTPLKFPFHARVLLDVLAGLQYAHSLTDYDGESLAIVHRDISPQNIFITFDGQVKLLDFGIAKAATSSVQTATGVIKGKLTYMAPEQARGDDVDARSDLYAVGVMLWEAVAGRRRWPPGLSQPALYMKMATGELPESPNAAARGYPAALDDVVMKSLAPKPADRYQTAGEFYDALEGILRTLEPAPLRDLASVLSGAFVDGRQKMKNLIEEQFRHIEEGRPPSGPHQVPRVALPSIITGSESFDVPPEGKGTRAKAYGDASLQEQSQSEPAVVISDEQHKAVEAMGRSKFTFSARARGVMIASAVVSVLALAIIVTKSGKAPSQPVSPVVEAPAAEPHRDNVAVAAAPVPLPTAQVQAQEDPPASSVRRVDSHTRPPAPTRRDPVARPSAPDPVVAAAPPPAAPEAPPAPVPLHIQPGKPKVQLERDNPWP